ncbi:MAG: transketolase, partial [Candidatus Komeilibacteria bacterium CG10_big_fil_rev_8_21_14_0_10_41_13]
KILRSSSKDQITVVAAGITVFEALKAYDQLLNEKIKIRIIDLYSIKPLDIKTLTKAARETKGLITVEDHYPAGGLGEAVAAALSGLVKVEIMAVSKIPRSGRPDQLLNYEQINDQAIIKKVKEIIYGQKKK